MLPMGLWLLENVFERMDDSVKLNSWSFLTPGAKFGIYVLLPLWFRILKCFVVEPLKTFKIPMYQVLDNLLLCPSQHPIFLFHAPTIDVSYLGTQLPKE
jgi:hypothetical protein